MVDLKEIRAKYERELLDNVLPFWLKNGIDKVNGGIYTGLSEDGKIIETDKSVWFQGRALWVFSKAYELFKREEYLDASLTILPFLDKCFDSDGRMFFRVTKDGKKVIKRERYFFSETFAIIGWAQYYKISGDERYKEKALSLLEKVDYIRRTPGILTPKFNPETEASISFAEPMIMINVLSELRAIAPEKKEYFNSYISSLLNTIEKYFVRDEYECVVEQVAPDSSLMLDHFEGRILNPGHALEASWFIMKEGLYRKDKAIIDLGLKIFSWEWKLGWDEEYGGGIIQYRDILSLPLSEYHQDMKFWWPQTEAVISSLMSYAITKDEKYLKLFSQVDDYIASHFIDRENGEWYGYLHRDGTIATKIKGNMYKGPFHIPRMYMEAIEIIDSL